MKQAFLIAGFRMDASATHEIYKDLREAIAAKGYQVVPVPFSWKYVTVAEYCQKFVEFYNQHKAEHNIMIGNSYGAMVAFLTAPETRPDKVFACSLSPYFKEDLDKTTEEYRIGRFGKRRGAGQKYLSASETAHKINKLNIPVALMYGEKEKKMYSFLVDRVKESAQELKNCKLIEVPHAPHRLRDPAYIAGLVREL